MAIVSPIEEKVAVGSRRRLRVANPATKESLGEIRVDNSADVKLAVARARAAQPAWGALSFEARAKVMYKALDVLIAKQEEFIDVIVRDTGRSRAETVMMEIFAACDALAFYAKRAKKVLADHYVPMHLMRTKKLLMTYRPLGVVGIITPWNGPFILGLNPSVQALMAGNAVIVKPSEVTPYAGRLVAKLFTEAGLPENVLQCIEGDGETGAALVDSGVDKISFTGSVRTGRKVGEACGRNLIPCTLELGGKDPMVVCADADLERAAGGAVFGAFMNTGQYCCSTERVYVVESVADEFIAKVLAKVKALRQGREGDFDVGPMIWPQQLAVIEKQIADARDKGAKILTGGQRSPSLGDMFYEPTVLTELDHTMLIMTEETFGPVIPIVRVKDEAEAIRMANDSPYGLTANVWTKDEDKAIALARQLQAGSICVNDCAVTYGAHEAPFGGRKSSGVGQVNGETGLRGYAYATPIIIDRFNMKEEHVWYPYTPEKTKILRRIIKWVWGTKLGRKLS